MAQEPHFGPQPPHYRGCPITLRHARTHTHTLGRTPFGQEIRMSQRPLPDNTQHLEQTDPLFSRRYSNPQPLGSADEDMEEQYIYSWNHFFTTKFSVKISLLSCLLIFCDKHPAALRTGGSLAAKAGQGVLECTDFTVAAGSRKTNHPAPGLLTILITIPRQVRNNALWSICVVAGLTL